MKRPGLQGLATPETLHCAPVGWPGIRAAMARIVAWMGASDPALLISDRVGGRSRSSRGSAASPHVSVLQHGDRDDPGHRAAYDGALGLLAPFHAALAQPEWSAAMRAKTCFAAGLGIDAQAIDRDAARRRIGVGQDERIVLVVSGGGGRGFLAGADRGRRPQLSGARAGLRSGWSSVTGTRPSPAISSIEVGSTPPPRTSPAADLVIASTGNTTCQQILASGRPWLAVPEWRYFDEQQRKAEALATAGAATVRPHLPSSPQRWRDAVRETLERAFERASGRADRGRAGAQGGGFGWRR